MTNQSEFTLGKIVELEKRIQQLESIDSVPIVARAYSNSGQTLVHNTFTAINFNVTTINTRNTVTTVPNWRFNAPVGGYYHVAASLLIGVFDANWAVGEAQHLWVYVNGAAYTALDAFYNASAGGGAVLSGATDVQVNASDYIEIYGYQFSGVNQNLPANGNHNWVSIHRIRGY